MEELKDKLFYTSLCVFCFIVGAILGNVAPFNPQPKKQPIIIYKVDNAGVDIDGKIVDKEIIEGRHTITVASYGKFLVSKSQYESLKVGDDMPEYLKK